MSSRKSRQSRAEAERVAKQLALRKRRRLLWVAAGVVAVLAVFVAVVTANRPAHENPSPAAPSTVAVGRTTPPPWPVPADASAAAAAAGLPMLGEEGNALHFHAHLDIFVDGAPLQVPAEIGVDHARRQISPLHSHDVSGVIHIESADRDATFTLGQFFTEWQVSLGVDHIGGLRADEAHPLKVYVNGKVRDGDPAAIMLAAHDEIAIVYGAAPASIPSTYEWTNGL
jgi:hypothetical protein